MVWNHRIALILLECMMLGCSYGCMRNQRKSQIYGKNIAIKKVTDNMKNKKMRESCFWLKMALIFRVRKSSSLK